MKNCSPILSDPFEETLAQLLVELIEIRQMVVQKGHRRLNRFKLYFKDGNFTESARNLTHYLTLRHLDLRRLQDRLSRVGLASFGHCESAILPNLDSVIELLRRAVAFPNPIGPTAGELDCECDLLEKHVGALFGELLEVRKVRIMVTLPTEASKSDQLVRSLLASGMNCARINCAHDDQSIWQAMIDNVRRASEALGQPCKILMDLAGHKLRTGEVQLQPAVQHIKVKRDIYGKIIGPADVLLVEHSGGNLDDPVAMDLCIGLDRELHHQLQSGDRLYFNDNRGKQRYFDLLDKTDAGAWRAWCKNSAYLADEALLQWQRPDEDGYEVLGEFPLRLAVGKPVVIPLFVGDPLLLTYDDQPGCPATHDAHGVMITPARIACSNPGVLGSLRPGDPVWIDDGKLGAKVEQITEQGILLRVTHAGPKGVKLHENKGLNFPSTQLNLPQGEADGVELTETDYIGDDVNDLQAIALVGLLGCPGDAMYEVIGRVDFVCGLNGGQGAFREFAELTLKAQSS